MVGVCRLSVENTEQCPAGLMVQYVAHTVANVASTFLLPYQTRKLAHSLNVNSTPDPASSASFCSHSPPSTSGSWSEGVSVK